MVVVLFFIVESKFELFTKISQYISPKFRNSQNSFLYGKSTQKFGKLINVVTRMEQFHLRKIKGRRGGARIFSHIAYNSHSLFSQVKFMVSLKISLHKFLLALNSIHNFPPHFAQNSGFKEVYFILWKVTEKFRKRIKFASKMACSIFERTGEF